MSARLKCVSDPIRRRVNVGAYECPFSGVGIEYDPLGVKPGRTGITLHESGFIAANAEWNFPAVFSPFWRLYHNEARGHCVVFGERMIELTPRHLMLIPPRCLFHCLGGNPVPTFWLAFSFSHHPHSHLEPPILLLPRDTEMCLIRDLRELILADPEGRPTDPIYRHSHALLQVVLARPELRWSPAPPAQLERVRRHIESHLHTRLATTGLARLAGLSPAGFNRAFRRHFATSPARYVTEVRVREAARLLVQGTATLEAIAERTGFPNRAYFSRVFKQVTDESPAAFRRKHRR